MTKEQQALALLEQMVALCAMPLNDHLAAKQAVKVLQDALAPKDEKE